MKLIRKYGFLFLLILSAGLLHAQTERTQLAYKQLLAKNLDSAKINIDAAIVHPETIKDAQTWMIMGYVYKELYKSKESNNVTSPYRDVAVKAFNTAIQLDTKKENTVNLSQNLKFLGSKYYNDASKIMDTANYKIAIENFEKYKSAYKNADPAYDSRPKEVEFYLALSYKFQEAYESHESKTNLDLAKVYLMKTLDIDSNNVGANKNFGILYYNMGVNIIKRMEYDVTLENLYELQEGATRLFKQALPFMLKAHRLSPKDKAIVEGLQGIYYQLNDFTKSNEYKNLLEQLKKEN